MQKPPKKHPRTKIKRKFLILKDGIMMNWTANWIAPPKKYGHVCPVYRRKLTAEKPLKKAQLFITAAGTFKLTLDGEAFGNEVLAPGWTSYHSRLQYREYDLTNELSDRSAHELCVTVGEGWFRSNLFPCRGEISTERYKKPAAIIAELHLTFADGEIEVIPFGKETEVAPSALQYCDNFNGAVYNAALEESYRFEPVVFSDEYTKDILIPSEGVPVREQERFSPRAVFKTPKGETVVDFGQNIAGYVEFRLTANKGDRVKFSHGEVLDKDGNFYNANYRGAKALVEYTCKDGAQTFKPDLTFFGFRYIRLDEFPGAPTAENFTAIAVYSDMERTGFLTTAHPQLTQLFSNILWSQRDNFVDIPTDCPQRDERRGWTGDAQVFIRTACYNYNVKEFFKKTAETVSLGENYVILLACDNYDVFSFSSDSEREEDSSEVYTYIVAAVCPVKRTKGALSFHAYDNSFKCLAGDTVISAPELGFLFPAFDDRSSNIYSALYYTKNTAENQDAFIEKVFNAPLPMPASLQKESFPKSSKGK